MNQLVCYIRIACAPNSMRGGIYRRIMGCCISEVRGDVEGRE